ncbi:MAG TPA: rhodanese-like domain-containing protein [Saprospiraceae bacterium]|nr:rhodanese-like domain-containing protein [Saprospiraceae bacterium]
MSVQELLEKDTATIIDVREPFEFAEGHIEGSTNIPLNTVQNRVDDFQQMTKPLVMVCRSGGRSGMATAILKARGVEDVHNGGGWEQVNQVKTAM